jgi:hypothetical protein
MQASQTPSIVALSREIAAATQLPRGYTPSQVAQLSMVVRALQVNDQAAAATLWRSFVTAAFRSSSDDRLSPTIMYVLRASMVRTGLPTLSLVGDPLGDDAQLANVDLQNILQKQQQVLQMLSNLSKMLNDTAMAVIRKLGG